jgi:hypothetical protein
MSGAENSPSARECDVFTRYLCGLPPTSYVARKYAHAQDRNPAYAATASFDRFLIRFARLHPIATKLADVYSRLFAPASVLRKRLILLLAILESTTFSDAFLERVDSSSKVVIASQGAWRGFVLLIALLLSLLLLLPCRMLVGLGKQGGKS